MNEERLFWVYSFALEFNCLGYVRNFIEEVLWKIFNKVIDLESQTIEISFYSSSWFSTYSTYFKYCKKYYVLCVRLSDFGFLKLIKMKWISIYAIQSRFFLKCFYTRLIHFLMNMMIFTNILKNMKSSNLTVLIIIINAVKLYELDLFGLQTLYYDGIRILQTFYFQWQI